jgi:HK97 gp10 family phage protein
VSFKLSVNMAGFNAEMDAIAADCEAAARPAAQAAAQVLYDEVQRNVAGIKRKTGNLASSIYQAYSRDNSAGGKATYHVSWNARKAPHGHLVEFGHLQRFEISYDPKTRRFTTHKDKPLASPKQVAARPFIRPAVAKFEAAMQAAQERYLEELSKRGVTS